MICAVTSASTKSLPQPKLPADSSIPHWTLSVPRSTFSLNDFERGTSDCRSRLNRESGFERPDLDSRARNSEEKYLCRCPVRFLERGAEPARRAIFFRGSNNSRGLRGPEFYQRRLFHPDGDPARAGIKGAGYDPRKWPDLDLLRTGGEQSARNRAVADARS